MEEHMNPLVSIITPAYNCEKYIEETIISVLGQTYGNWEYIIVNDASSDGTGNILQEYADLDKRIRIVTLEKNEGVATARNVGTEEASGEYIAFLDSDDQWKKEKLERHMDFVLKNNLSFSYTAYEVVDEEGKHIKNIIPKKLKVNYKELLFSANVIPCCTVIIKSKLMKDEHMPNIPHEDFAAWLNILKKNSIEAVGMAEILSLYRKRSGSISSNKLRTIAWNWRIYYENQKLGFFRSLIYLICFIVRTGIKYIKK